MGELRKLLPRGGSLHITIPRAWLREMGLTKGDLVMIERTTQGTITVTPLRRLPGYETTNPSHTA